MLSSPPTSASQHSPDFAQHPVSRHQLDDARPEEPTRSLSTPLGRRNSDHNVAARPKSATPWLTRPDSLPHEESPLSRERSGLVAGIASYFRSIRPTSNSAWLTKVQVGSWELLGGAPDGCRSRWLVTVGLDLARRVLVRGADNLAPQTARLLEAVIGHTTACAEALSCQPTDVPVTRRKLRELLGWSDVQVRRATDRLVALEYLVVAGGGRERVPDLPLRGRHRPGWSPQWSGWSPGGTNLVPHPPAHSAVVGHRVSADGQADRLAESLVTGVVTYPLRF